MSHKRTINIKGWTSVLVASLFFFYWFIQLSLSNTLVNYYTDKYALTQYGLFTSMYLFGNVIMLIPAGVLLDRYSPKSIITLAVLAMVMGVTGMLITNETLIAYACMLLVGFAGSFALLGCVRVAANWFEEGSVGFPISIAITIGFLGSYLGNAAGEVLLAYFDSGAAVQVVDILLGLLLLVVIVFFVKTPKTLLKTEPHQNLAHALSKLLKVMRKRQNWFAGLYISLMNFPVMILEFSFGQAYLDHAFALTKHQSANITGIISIGFMIGGPIWNKLSDISNLRRPYMISGAIFSLIITMLLFIHSFTAFELTIIFFLIGVFTSAQTLGYPLITESNDPDISASATSLASMLIMGGGALSQIAFGYIEVGVGYEWAYWLIPICIIVALILALMLQEASRSSHRASG